MYKFINSIILTILLTSVFLAANSSVPTTGLISEDLRLELRTQELILERIIKHYDKNNIITHHNIVSHYIKNYGSVFETQRNPTSELNLFNQFGAPDNPGKTKYIWSEEKNAIVKFESKHSFDDSLEVIKIVDEYLRDLHLAIFEFFADYMSEANYLKDSDWISIHFDLKLYNKIPKEYNRNMIENIVPIAFQASIKYSDLKDFQKGKLNIEQLDRKIDINKIYVNHQSYSDKILGDVLQSAMKSIKSDNERPFSLHTTSFNLKNLGKVYFLSTQYRPNRSINDIDNFFEFLFGTRTDTENYEKEQKQYNKLINEFKFRLVKSVAQYGHKLKNVKEEEQIVLITIIGHYGKIKSWFATKILKKNINELEENKISFEEFQDRVEIYDEELYLK